MLVRGIVFVLSTVAFTFGRFAFAFGVRFALTGRLSFTLLFALALAFALPFRLSFAFLFFGFLGLFSFRFVAVFEFELLLSFCSSG